MKYLKGRNNYLNELKLNSGIVPYEANIDMKLNEEVMSNTIKWGDSMLGRLINSMIRKAKVGISLLRIGQVIKSLYRLFDQMIEDGVLKSIPSGSKISFFKLQLSMLIGEVEKVSADAADFILNDPDVDSEVENIDEIKDITDNVIKEVSIIVDQIIKENDKSGDIPKDEITELKDDKELIIEGLTKFRESLDEIKTGEDDGGDDGKEEVKSDDKKDIVFSESMNQNLKSVYMILFYYHQTIVAKKPTNTSAVNPEVKKQPTSTGQKIPVVNKAVAESLLNESVLSSDLSNAIKPLYTYFTGAQFKFPDKAQDRDNEFHKFIIGSKDGVLKLYKSITLIKENLLSDLLTKPEKVGSHIFNLYKTTRTKPSGDFPGVEGDFKDQIKKFNATMKEILDSVKVESKSETSEDIEVGKKYKYTNKEGEVKDVLVVDKDKVVQPGPDKKFLTDDDKKGNDLNKGEISVASDKSKVTFPVRPDSLKKESRLFNYIDFIRESDENKDKDDWLSEVHKSWKLNFLGTFKNLSKYKFTQEQIESLKKEFESSDKKTKYLEINGKDPVIEIVRLFNRAYKLHTTQVIPTGRSGGEVSNKTFLEYESFGSSSSGTPESAGKDGGPYRNKAVFYKWENAVLDIISSSQYRIIFNKSTTIKVGEGDPVPSFGKKLLNFMNELLDNTKLYQAGEQKKFIDKYFNIEVQDTEVELPGGNDLETNDGTSKGVESGEKKVDFVSVDEICFFYFLFMMSYFTFSYI